MFGEYGNHDEHAGIESEDEGPKPYFISYLKIIQNQQHQGVALKRGVNCESDLDLLP